MLFCPAIIRVVTNHGPAITALVSQGCHPRLQRPPCPPPATPVSVLVAGGKPTAIRCPQPARAQSILPGAARCCAEAAPESRCGAPKSATNCPAHCALQALATRLKLCVPRWASYVVPWRISPLSGADRSQNRHRPPTCLCASTRFDLVARTFPPPLVLLLLLLLLLRLSKIPKSPPPPQQQTLALQLYIAGASVPTYAAPHHQHPILITIHYQPLAPVTTTPPLRLLLSRPPRLAAQDRGHFLD